MTSSKLTDIGVKTLQNMETLYKHTLADPNAFDPYMRGYTNGIRLMYAVLHGQKPDFVDAPLKAAKLSDTPLTPEPMAQQGAIVWDRTDLAPQEPDTSHLLLALDELKSATHGGLFERRLLQLLDMLVRKVDRLP